DRFYKLSDESSSNGLGLAITQSIIHLHHGSITLTSDDKTQFIVKLFI
ncbi:two-component sensor histidine kinase, partial [Streptococcus pneumoniae]|nr:two-component sensor histidine kinase [Streptococcus pneumoniae]